jgi:hypothetical protein
MNPFENNGRLDSDIYEKQVPFLLDYLNEFADVNYFLNLEDAQRKEIVVANIKKLGVKSYDEYYIAMLKFTRSDLKLEDFIERQIDQSQKYLFEEKKKFLNVLVGELNKEFLKLNIDEIKIRQIYNEIVLISTGKDFLKKLPFPNEGIASSNIF